VACERLLDVACRSIPQLASLAEGSRLDQLAVLQKRNGGDPVEATCERLMDVAVVASHSLIVPSPDPNAICFLSAEKAIAYTGLDIWCNL